MNFKIIFKKQCPRCKQFKLRIFDFCYTNNSKKWCDNCIELKLEAQKIILLEKERLEVVKEKIKHDQKIQQMIRELEEEL